MLLPLSCLAIFLNGGQAQPSSQTAELQLIPAPGIHRLVDRIGVPGVGFVGEKSTCHVLSAKGKEEKQLRMGSGDIPLWIEDKRLVKSQGLVYSDTEDTVGRPQMKIFAQGGLPMYLYCGLVVDTGYDTLTLPRFEYYGAIAVDKEKSSAITLTATANIFLLTAYSNTSRGWLADDLQIAPTFENVAFPGIANRMNDLRFISKDKAVFIGSISSAIENRQFLARFRANLMIRDKVFRREPSFRSNRTLFLMVLDLADDSHIQPILECVADGSGERGGFLVGNLSVSSDEKMLYIAGVDQIGALDIPSILEWHKRITARKPN